MTTALTVSLPWCPWRKRKGKKEGEGQEGKEGKGREEKGEGGRGGEGGGDRGREAGGEGWVSRKGMWSLRRIAPTGGSTMSEH